MWIDRSIDQITEKARSAAWSGASIEVCAPRAWVVGAGGTAGEEVVEYQVEHRKRKREGGEKLIRVVCSSSRYCV
jgi:hypothetical protein